MIAARERAPAAVSSGTERPRSLQTRQHPSYVRVLAGRQRSLLGVPVHGEWLTGRPSALQRRNTSADLGGESADMPRNRFRPPLPPLHLPFSANPRRRQDGEHFA